MIEKLANARLRGDKAAWVASPFCASERAAKFLYGRAWQGATLAFDEGQLAVMDSKLLDKLPIRNIQAYSSGVEGALFSIHVDMADDMRLKPSLGTDTIIITLPPGELHLRCTKAGDVLAAMEAARSK